MIDQDELEREIELVATPRETVWVGDPAVDIGSSDIAAILRTGEMEGVALHAGQKASIIKWRAIDPEERRVAVALAQYTKAEDGEIDPAAWLALCLQCARFGLLDVGGVTLTRRRYRGHLGLDDATMRRLGHIRTTSQPEGSPVPSDLGFLAWIGGLIITCSFRGS